MACAAVGGLGLSRVLYEALFPRAVWLGHPAAALGLALLAGLSGWWLGRVLQRRVGTVASMAPFLPLLLNAQAVLQPEGATLLSRLLLAGSLWLAVAITLLMLWPERQRLIGLAMTAAVLLPVYLLTMGRTVGRADTFEFQVVIPQLGIVHPTGYPLYMLLGKLFTFIPVGPVAWRINLASAVFGTVAAGLVFLFVWQVTWRALPGMLAALLFGLAPTFWSQAIEAEVYALHAVVVGGVLWGIGRLGAGDWRLGNGKWGLEIGDWRLRSWRVLVLVFLLVGVGLANHLTTIVLLPGVVLAALFVIVGDWRRAERGKKPRLQGRLQSLISSLLMALIIPLLLYAYLPIRWAAVNNEPMGLGRFVDWVIGGRFQGALQLDAFLNDPSRYAVVGRLLLAEWQPWWLLAPAALGFAWLVWRRWRLALILGLTLIGFVFYGLSYYVPDLAVFLLPAQLLMAVMWGVGVGRLEIGDWRLEIGDWRLVVGAVLAVGVMGVMVNGVAGRWEEVDRSEADGGVPWARAVLERSLQEGAAILADSARFPPLYYLQQAEGVRPDLDIVVLPDEAAYRAELSARLAVGQTVYLARFLPGLEGQYHLRSEGPLVEVGREPLEALPPDATGSDLDFGNVELEGYELADPAAADAGAVALMLYWRADEAPEEALYVYTRWQGPDYDGAPLPAGGQHPANNSYPTAAWAAGEVVPDYHLLPRPLLGQTRELALQVALAPPFSASEALDWQTVTTATVAPPDALPDAEPVYAQVGAAVVDGVQVENQVRPQPGLPAFVSGCGDAGVLQLELRRAGEEASGQGAGAPVAACGDPYVLRQAVDAEREAGDYALWAFAGGGARCHWLAPITGGCRLVAVEISGAALPAGATNFGDRIALTSLEVTESDLRPGGEVTVEVTWQALAGMEENYTVFAQVVDAQDRIVGQVDTWPVQGTFGTSAWAPGEVVRDSYTVRLEGDVVEGEYRLLLGWYLLATQQRLPVLDEGGAIVDDRVVVPLDS